MNNDEFIARLASDDRESLLDFLARAIDALPIDAIQAITPLAAMRLTRAAYRFDPDLGTNLRDTFAENIEQFDPTQF